MNEKVKHREPFRPFAPSCLAERSGEYFASDHPSPVMLLVFDVLEHRGPWCPRSPTWTAPPGCRR